MRLSVCLSVWSESGTRHREDEGVAFFFLFFFQGEEEEGRDDQVEAARTWSQAQGEIYIKRGVGGGNPQ